MIDWNSILVDLLTAVLFGAITAAVAVLTSAAKSVLVQQAGKISQAIGENNYRLLEQFAYTLTRTAEQLIFGEKKGDERKSYVLREMREMADKWGIDATDKQLSDLIEAAVHDLNLWQDGDANANALTIYNNG